MGTPIKSMSTGSSAFLEALVDARVSHIFANLGSDHPALLEAIAAAKAVGREVPTLITCPTEMVALSAAHGFAQVSGVAQAVVVHVDCGTQSLAGAVHNAARGRVPVLIYAGMSPFSQRGEMRGSRNEFAQWLQDGFDQRGLVRGFVKYDNEFRSAETIREVTHRALRFAYSDPKGPVYLTAAREVMEAPASAQPAVETHWNGISVSALPSNAVKAIAESLVASRRPLVVTSYVGRRPGAVQELVKLCERLSIGVLESVPTYANFPHDHALYLGSRWNDPRQEPHLSEADVVLVVDSDVPWIPVHGEPSGQAVLHHIDVDPLKSQMPLSAVSSRYAYQVDAETALRQINSALDELQHPSRLIEQRLAEYQHRHDDRARNLLVREQPREDVVTPEYLTACLRRKLGPEALILSEGVSNYQVICDHLRLSRPGSLFASGGSSLGWNGGAAIGAKLARPEKTVVALTGDGSYMFSIPSSVHWMARRYATPFLQVIYNNGGWKSPKLSMLAVHPSGYGSRSTDIGVSFAQAPDYVGIAAAAGGALGRKVVRPEELDGALEEVLHAVRSERRAAVLDVELPSL
jgi:acetolactate synthase-1/2/3 large subunit